MSVAVLETLGTPLVDPGRRGACLLCGATDGPIVVSEDGYNGRSCECGVVYVDPFPSTGAVDLAEDHHLETYYSLPAQVRLDWISRFRTRGRVLEVGCGDGHFLGLAKARGFEVAAVEANANSVRAASATLGIEVEHGLIEDTSLPANSFDIVFHVDLMSHFPDPVRALAKMAELVRPDGVVCFEVGVFGGLAPAWYPWVGRIGYPQHLWLYSEAAIRSVLSRAGLEVQAIQRFGLIPATILSTLGNALLRRRIHRPQGEAGRAARPGTFYHAYSWLQYVLRYRIGKFIPAFGPHTMLVAARRL